MAEGEPSVFRDGGVSYLRIPTGGRGETPAFYEAVFGWSLRGDPAEPGFSDGSGHVIGHFVADIPIAGEAGVRPYVYVDRLDAALERARANGGELVKPPYPEGDLWVAVVRDPAGNLVGLWQHGDR